MGSAHKEAKENNDENDHRQMVEISKEINQIQPHHFISVFSLTSGQLGPKCSYICRNKNV